MARRSGGGAVVVVSISYLEIYNENVYDLLDPCVMPGGGAGRAHVCERSHAAAARAGTTAPGRSQSGPRSRCRRARTAAFT
jgi:hypothetical protein